MRLFMVTDRKVVMTKVYKNELCVAVVSCLIRVATVCRFVAEPQKRTSHDLVNKASIHQEPYFIMLGLGPQSLRIIII